MTKNATIASLVRQAARTEADFAEIVQQVLDAGDLERTAEFFDRMNIPRSVPGNLLLEDLSSFQVEASGVGDYAQEVAISRGIQKYMERHVRKVKWHAGHPSIEGIDNVTLLFRCCAPVTELRLKRLHLLLKSKDLLSPTEWAYAREIMNATYLSFRNFLNLMGSDWIDSINLSLDRNEVSEKLRDFYELVDQAVRSLEEHRTRIEERRLELTVSPEGFPPVKPPNYFGGDIMGLGPWTQYWKNLNSRAHHFRETAA